MLLQEIIFGGAVKTFQSIQYLRGLAALMVVFHHARNPEPWLFDPLAQINIGSAGVDIFFVISGFVMYASARQLQPSQFMFRRVVRIVPMYWLATLLTFAIFQRVVWPGLVLGVIKSLLFVPHHSFRGDIWPYLIPGWTLNLEMFFYLIFAAGLFWRRWLVPWVAGVIGVLVVAGFLFSFSNALWLTYTKPMMLEFVCGIMIARFEFVTTKSLAPWLLIFAPLGLVGCQLFHLPRLSMGVPAIALVAGSVGLERAGWLPEVRFLRRLGDASYSIYLFQVLAIAAAATIVSRLPLGGPVQLLAMIVTALAASITIGMLSYRLIERPITARFQRRVSAVSPAV